jgi:hypothetical protein
MREFPLLSTAMQYVVAHETEVMLWLGSIEFGDDQDVPLKVRALLLSTATHNDDDAHDTELSCVPESIEFGDDQDVPLKVRAWPLLSTATQNVLLAHETDVMLFPDSTEVCDHVPLL